MSKFENQRDAGLTVLYYALALCAMAFTANALFFGNPVANISDDRIQKGTGGSPVDPGIPISGDTICFENLVSGTVLADTKTREQVMTYINNHIERGLVTSTESYRVAKGFIVTNKILHEMVYEHNSLRRIGRDVGGFHVYFGDMESSGGRDIVVLSALDNDLNEHTRDNYKVIEVTPMECAPCPMLCEGYNLLPSPPTGGG